LRVSQLYSLRLVQNEERDGLVSRVNQWGRLTVLFCEVKIVQKRAAFTSL
jgi:hypothetical protein